MTSPKRQCISYAFTTQTRTAVPTTNHSRSERSLGVLRNVPAPSLTTEHLRDRRRCRRPVTRMRRRKDVPSFGAQDRLGGAAGERRVVLRRRSGDVGVGSSEGWVDDLRVRRVAGARLRLAGTSVPSVRLPDVLELLPVEDVFVSRAVHVVERRIVIGPVDRLEGRGVDLLALIRGGGGFGAGVLALLLTAALGRAGRTDRAVELVAAEVSRQLVVDSTIRRGGRTRGRKRCRRACPSRRPSSRSECARCGSCCTRSWCREPGRRSDRHEVSRELPAASSYGACRKVRIWAKRRQLSARPIIVTIRTRCTEARHLDLVATAA